MKICIITACFSLTGVPLAQVRLARALLNRGHDVELLFGNVNDSSTFSPPDGIPTTVLFKLNVRSMLWPLVRYLHQKQPDLVFSAEDHLNAFVLLASILSGSAARVSGSSRILPTDRFAYSNRLFSKGWILKQTMRLLMKRASVLSCVSQEMVLHYKKVFPNGPHVCIYNIIRDSESIRRARTAVDHPWLSDSSIPVIISAGTLTRRKGFADLIYAFAEVCKRRSVRLILLGEGCLRPELEAMICKLGISSVADMPGNVSNPLAYFAKAQVFVLSSYAEGLPNVLVEAMICGCTPVATDCPTGPREVLGAGRFGYLTPMGDPATMATAIEKALDNPISSKLLEEAISPFDENRVIDRHFEMLGLCVS